MTDQFILDIGLSALVMAAKLSAPMLLTALIVGFIISLFQSVTQIQEVTLTFVPKAIAVGVALVITGGWMIAEMVTFTQDLFSKLSEVL